MLYGGRCEGLQVVQNGSLQGWRGIRGRCLETGSGIFNALAVLSLDK